MQLRPLPASRHLADVRYEIRGSLARRAHEMETAGYDIVKLNIGNPGIFGFRTPESMRRAIIENMQASEAYCHQKGIFPAREAVVMHQQDRGIMDVDADDVFMGNGVSELITMCLKALLNPGDEVLVPSPDYPLWTAAVTMSSGTAVHYPCRPENSFQPVIDDLRERINERTRAIVVINPNNPTGAVYDESLLAAIGELAEEHQLVVFADEIYDEILYGETRHHPMARFVRKTLCATFNGLSKIWRACGYRVGWVSFSGEKSHARAYFDAIELLASLRLCSNVPGQWAVQTALGGYQSIYELTGPGGRLFDSRQAVIDAVEASPYLRLHAPAGSMYAFVEADTTIVPDFDDQRFAHDLLEQKNVLISPGSSFNVPYANHFRITLLPEDTVLRDVFVRIDELLAGYAGD